MSRLLIVDDEPDVREFAKNFFSKRKLEVFTAATGEEAIEIVKTSKPNVALLDIRMEGMDGLEALKKFKEIQKDIRVIMVTGVNDAIAMQKAKDLGAHGYIHKPLILDELEKIVMKEFESLKK
jgi:two-component system response regulator (stage 0 sporulation protein F)